MRSQNNAEKRVWPPEKTPMGQRREPRTRLAKHPGGIHEGCGRSVCLLITIIALLATYVSAGQSSSDKSERERRIELLRSYASRHQIAPASRPDSPFKFRRDPLIYWTNPTRGNHFGGVFLWTRNSRPVAYAGILLKFQKPVNRLARSYHSLTKEHLVADFDDKRIWAPTSPGVQFRLVPNAKSPAQASAARVRQMRAIGSRFSVSISGRDSVVTETLRMLPRPIYRYSDIESGLIDAAIIAFVQGNDPEALLLVEARSNDSGRQWHYAIARATNWAVTARLGDDVVYNVPFVVPAVHRRNASAAFAGSKWIPVE